MTINHWVPSCERCRFLSVFLFVLVASAPSVASSQAPNFEIQKNGRSGYMGTYGNRNFDVTNRNGRLEGLSGGQPPGLNSSRPGKAGSNIGSTHHRCFVDDQGRAFCD